MSKGSLFPNRKLYSCNSITSPVVYVEYVLNKLQPAISANIQKPNQVTKIANSQNDKHQNKHTKTSEIFLS